MTATLVSIADGVKAALVAGQIYFAPLEFTPARSYADWSHILDEDMDTLQVDIVPWSETVTLDSVGSVQYICEIDVLVRQRMGANNQKDSSGRIKVAEVDKLVLLVEQIAEFFMPCQPNQDGRRLTDITEAAWQDAKIISPYVRRHLRENRQFTGWVRLVYSLAKAIGDD